MGLHCTCKESVTHQHGVVTGDLQLLSAAADSGGAEAGDVLGGAPVFLSRAVGRDDGHPHLASTAAVQPLVVGRAEMCHLLPLHLYCIQRDGHLPPPRLPPPPLPPRIPPPPRPPPRPPPPPLLTEPPTMSSSMSVSLLTVPEPFQVSLMHCTSGSVVLHTAVEESKAPQSSEPDLLPWQE